MEVRNRRSYLSINQSPPNGRERSSNDEGKIFRWGITSHELFVISSSWRSSAKRTHHCMQNFERSFDIISEKQRPSRQLFSCLSFSFEVLLASRSETQRVHIDMCAEDKPILVCWLIKSGSICIEILHMAGKKKKTRYKVKRRLSRKVKWTWILHRIGSLW